jgi:hypothetical protein
VEVLLHETASPFVPREQRDDRAPAAEQAVGDLDQQSGAVAALAVGVEPTAVGESGQGLHTESDGLVAELGRGDKSHSAGGPGRGKLPRPGKTRSIERWGHCPKRLRIAAEFS